MLITCEQCQARYNLADHLITRPQMKVRCSKCNHIFMANRPDVVEPAMLLPEEAALPEQELRIITVSNQKGGVAKTSTALNLAASLATLGRRVLLVDFDMQSSLTIALGMGKNAKSFYDLLHVPGNTLQEIIQKTKYPNLWLLPSNPNMALLAKKNLTEKNFEHILRDRLETIRTRIDHIIIDTPPSLEFFTLNALMASDFAIIPTPCEYLSMHGVAHMDEAIGVINKLHGKKIAYKILITMFNPDNTAVKVIFNKLKEKYSDRLFRTIIELDTKVQESQIMNAPVIHYDKASVAAGQYLELARELTGQTD
ncbi:MAG TPA: AAA family ATPase [Desulfurivibrionaceae bacterium]|nr:AAA family ATPase [Desulfurivibrionaceae bacterium]